ncbi:MAG: alanine racemase [bacterium]|nr:alanine racemase [Candidatus Aquidulcis sp.]
MSGIPELVQQAGLPALGRDAWVEVRLDAIANNVRALKGKLPSGGHLDVVLKADAYGLGAVAVARAALDAGARAVLVATFDEAQELRDAGITDPVRALWRVAPAHLRDAAAMGIGVTASSPAVVRELLGVDLAGLPPLSVDIEVDTGLGRDGILPSELAAQLALLRSSPNISLRSIWSHLTAAEDVDRSRLQEEVLEQAATQAPDLESHLVGSGGLLTIGGTQRVARAGIALFGVVPNALRPTMTAAAIGIERVYGLAARPVRIASLPAGHGVGYGPAFVAERESRIITLPIGYADGISYHERGVAEVLVRGVRLPVVGTIAMDSITIDATDHPAKDLTERDEVVFIGQSGAEVIESVDVAKRRKTITNEVSTSFTSRLARVYTVAGRPVAVRDLRGYHYVDVT